VAPGETVFIKRGRVYGFTENLPVHPQPGRAWPAILQGDGRFVFGRHA
jgi:hypothetical protein